MAVSGESLRWSPTFYEAMYATFDKHIKDWKMNKSNQQNDAIVALLVKLKKDMERCETVLSKPVGLVPFIFNEFWRLHETTALQLSMRGESTAREAQKSLLQRQKIHRKKILDSWRASFLAGVRADPDTAEGTGDGLKGESSINESQFCPGSNSSRIDGQVDFGAVEQSFFGLGLGGAEAPGRGVDNSFLIDWAEGTQLDNTGVEHELEIFPVYIGLKRYPSMAASPEKVEKAPGTEGTAKGEAAAPTGFEPQRKEQSQNWRDFLGGPGGRAAPAVGLEQLEMIPKEPTSTNKLMSDGVKGSQGVPTEFQDEPAERVPTTSDDHLPALQVVELGGGGPAELLKDGTSGGNPEGAEDVKLSGGTEPAEPVDQEPMLVWANVVFSKEDHENGLPQTMVLRWPRNITPAQVEHITKFGINVEKNLPYRSN